MADFKEALEKAISQADSGGGSDEFETTDIGRPSMEPTGAKSWTASYPVSLLIGVTLLAIAGFCFLAYSFAIQEQPLSKRLAGKSAQNGPTSALKTKGNGAELDKPESDKNVEDRLESKWLRNAGNPYEVRGFDVADGDFKDLSTGPRIDRLEIQTDSLTARGIESIAAFPSLGHLLFRYSKLPRHTFSALAKSPTLYILDVSYSNPIDSQDLQQLASSPTLITLKMAHTEFGDEHAKAIVKTHLTGLMVNDTQVTDAALPSLAKIKTLKMLTILPAKGITDEGLRRFRKLRPDCTILTDND
jgi:hypothetical protein